MIKNKVKCSYHFIDIIYVCTYVECNFQTRLKCLQCSKPNQVLHHQHLNVQNCCWVIGLLKYHIDELITHTEHFYFKQRTKQLMNSFLELNHYLSCLCEWKLGNVIQQNYSNLLQIIGPTLKQLDFNQQNIYRISQFIKEPNSVSDNDHFSFLKMWRKYMMSFALISDDENHLVLGWRNQIAIYQLNNLNSVKYIYLGSRFNQCQFTQNSRRLLVGCDGVLHLYDVNRQFIQIKNTKFKNIGRACVRNIFFLNNNIVLINVFFYKFKTQILKFHINNNKQIYKLTLQDDLHFQYDFRNNMLILNNKNSIKIFQESDKRQVIQLKLPHDVLSQTQLIKDNIVIAHCKDAKFLFFQIDYQQNKIQQIREINLKSQLFFYNGITQEIIVQTEKDLILINCNNFEQINVPYRMDNKNVKYIEGNRMLKPQQNSIKFLITFSKNCIALFKRK